MRFTRMALCAVLLATGSAAAAEMDTVKPRVIVVSDIGNEPDDAESLVRLLLYTNQLDLHGLVASTSTHQREVVHPEMMLERIDGYAKVLPNLRAHDKAFPDAALLRARVFRGQAHYGMSHVGDGFDSEGSNAIIAEADRPDPRPLWVLNWGGSADLAQALYTVRKTRSPEQLKAFVARLRVYSISDQDDAGPWVRQNFPDLFWIASIHAFGKYDASQWRGISGEVMIDPHGEHIGGPDTSLVTNEWLDAHIRKGPLGSLYPRWAFQMEGDTPSFLYLVSRGLNDPEHPDWGSWGGRYGKVAPQYGLYADAADSVVGMDGQTVRTNQAAVWRWRKAYQDDFAARIQWTLAPKFKDANHAPLVMLNGEGGFAPVNLTVKAGEKLALSAAGTRDPDGNALTYTWWLYREVGARDKAAEIVARAGDPAAADFFVPAGATTTRQFHAILEVWDNGTPALVGYRRAVITVTP